MSRGITLTVLAGLMLTACLATGGCGRGRQPDHTWYDSGGNAIAEKWTTDAGGKRVPDPHPYDRYGRQWVYDADGNLVPLPPPGGYSRSPGLWLWGGSGYRSYSTGPSYRSGGGSSSSPSRSSSSSSSSVSRGGFGSTGSSSSGS
jgi:hypothetical protein